MTAPTADVTELTAALPAVDRMLTVDEVTVILRKSRTTVYRLMASHGLPYRCVAGGDRRVPAPELQRWLDTQPGPRMTGHLRAV
jgi:excisionase family DNA binding protein